LSATTQTVFSYNSFQDYHQSLAPTETFFLGNISIPFQLHKLVSDVHNSHFAMASDGSVRSPNGSFAWVLYGTKSQIHLTGQNTLTGGHSDLSTFRAEACGYLGALYALKAILTTFPPLPNSSHITSNLHIDNLGIVRRSQDIPFSIQQCLQPDWDIMHEAYKVRAILPATITILHVQSHQDKTTTNPNSLSLAAHLNIFADSKTHQAYKDCPHFHQTPILPSTQAVLVLNGWKVTSKMTTLASLAYITNQLCRTTSSINLIGMPPHLVTLTGILQRESTSVSPQAASWHPSNSKMACGQQTKSCTNANRYHLPSVLAATSTQRPTTMSSVANRPNPYGSNSGT
jgi:hypothetical protein